MKMQTHKYGLNDVEHAIKLLAGEVPGEEGIHFWAEAERLGS